MTDPPVMIFTNVPDIAIGGVGIQDLKKLLAMLVNNTNKQVTIFKYLINNGSEELL